MWRLVAQRLKTCSTTTTSPNTPVRVPIIEHKCEIQNDTVYEDQRHEARMRCAKLPASSRGFLCRSRYGFFLNPLFEILMKCKKMMLTKLLFRLTASGCCWVNSMKIILARQLELEAESLNSDRPKMKCDKNEPFLMPQQQLLHAPPL